MKLVYPDWRTSIEFRENRIPIVVIERPEYYRQVIIELKGQVLSGNGRFVLSEGNRILELNKWAEIVLSPFLIDMSDSRVIKRIYKQLEEVAKEEELVETRELMGTIKHYLCRLSDYLGYELVINDDIDLQSLFKGSGIRPDHDDSNMVSALVDYLDILRALLNMELIILVNLGLYLTRDELRAFYDTISKKKIRILMLENRIDREIMSCEDVLTIDSDLCEI